MSWSVEVESRVSAVRLFKAALLDWHNLGPKLVPEIVASGAGLEGSGGVGSVRQLNFTSAMPFSHLKERLEFVDHDRFECKTTIVEGGPLGSKLESASAHFKLEQTGSGGCLVKMVATYKALPGVDVAGETAKAKESVVRHLKAVEGYLLANPDAYA